MVKIIKLTLAVFGGLIFLFASLQALAMETSLERPVQMASQTPFSPTPVSPILIQNLPVIDNLPLEGNPEIYKYDDPGSIVSIYVTVRKGNVSDNSAYTWKEVNEFTKYNELGLPILNVVVGKIDAIVQFGDETGPLPDELGYGVIVPNATIQIRGATTSKDPQKSYKIELLSSAGLWRGQSTLDLNKHPYDETRFRNKLNFDLLKQIPNLTSLRTQFVHLYVKDETTNSLDATFDDYGLFTQVEQPNRRFLKNHLLDPDGQLYKATFFEFHRYPNQLRLATDPLYDVQAFSPILEIKGNNDHSKLIQMLDDINNYEIPIEVSFAKYFNADNYFTWLAYNILVGNVDTQSQNFYLYSPHNGNTWYFLPWDYDGALPLQVARASEGNYSYSSWENGVSNYWGVVLFNRLFRDAGYRKDLDHKVMELKNFLTPEKIQGMIDIYQKAIDPYVLRMPDVQNLQLKTRDSEIKLIPGDIQANYDLYVESLKKPMPFFLGTPTISAENINFHWEDAYEFNGQDITYHFAVSTDGEFKKIIAQADLTNITNFVMKALKPGIYYWRVIAENTSGQTQIAFDKYTDASGVRHDGGKYLNITFEGEVLEK